MRYYRIPDWRSACTVKGKKEEGELLQEDLGPSASHLSLAILSKAPGKLGGCRKSKGLPIFGWSFESL